jgi:cytochrome c553
MVASGALAIVLMVAGLLGLVVVPVLQARGSGVDPWTAICRAAGLTSIKAPKLSLAAIGPPISTVAWGARTLDGLDHGDIRAGAQLAAQTCAACHGEAGVSANAQFPVLADQSPAAIYKQLRDFRSGARSSPFMTPLVQNLSERQMVDLADYYGHDHAFNALGPRWPVPDPASEALATRGDPSRDLPACDACHGRGVGGPIETPTLNGQYEEYLLAQLQVYATGDRRNDVYGRMRVIAKRLTPGERARLAEYYQGLVG